MKNCNFDPFQDRLSRDIRNGLSASFHGAILHGDISPVYKTAEAYLEQKPSPCYTEYIRNRLQKYEQFFTARERFGDDLFRQALVLWDMQLFFEVHEVLENEWLRAEGEKKLVLQAMIRAAGSYMKLESGYDEAALKIAGRAIPVLEDHKEYLAQYFNPEKLLRCLRDLTLPPPVLLDS